MKMSVERWWNDTDRRKEKYAEKNAIQCHFVHHISHKDRNRTGASAVGGERLTT
jgi:hypothetical protein